MTLLPLAFSALDVPRAVAAFVLVIVSVVVVHEGGHFVLGKLSGIRVDEFAVGFGPRLLSIRRGETVYALRAIPAGGFVRLAGMSPLEESDAGERSFYRAKIWKRILTIAAGGVINLGFAGLLFGVANIPSVASVITPGSGADQAGLHPGDRITAVNQQSVSGDDPATAATVLHGATQTSRGKPLQVQYKRPDGRLATTSVTPHLVLLDGIDPSTKGAPHLNGGPYAISAIDGRPVGTGDPASLLGHGSPVTIDGREFGASGGRFHNVVVTGVTTGDGAIGKLEAAWRIGYGAGKGTTNPVGALGSGIAEVPSDIGATFTSLYDVVTTPGSGGLTGSQGASGPVGIFQATSSASRSGWVSLVEIMGLISLNLGLINLLPIPFLDGGRLVFVIIEGIRRRAVDPRTEAMIHAAGLAVVACFAIYITIFGDISRLTNHS